MKHVLITGATAGIGKVTARELAKQNYSLTIVGRSEEKTKAAVEELKSETKNNNIDFLIGDMCDLDSVQKLSDDFLSKHNHLYMLINNAGAVFMKHELTKDGYEKTFVNNHLGQYLLTKNLLPMIKNNSEGRIINVASIAHFDGRPNFDDIHFKRGKYHVLKSYSNSKLYNILHANYLAQELQGTGITANSLHPGVVKTKIGNKNTNAIGGFLWQLFTVFKGISEEDGAKTTLHVATHDEGKNVTGEYFDKSKIVKPSEHALNPSNSKKLIEISEDLLNKRK